MIGKEGRMKKWVLVPLLVSPGKIGEHLEVVRRSGRYDEVPNLWQLGLGVVRMWHRLLFRMDTVGTCGTEPVRRTWRARLLAPRALRLPFLLAEGAVVPLDLTGLRSGPETIIRHLLGAHHDGVQFVYDLEILACYPGQLEVLERAVREVLAGGPRADWLRDLTVYERYHEHLHAAVQRALAGELVDGPAADDPDLSFGAYLRWCARQPETPAATLEALLAGELSFAPGPVPALQQVAA